MSSAENTLVVVIAGASARLPVRAISERLSGLGYLIARVRDLDDALATAARAPQLQACFVWCLDERGDDLEQVGEVAARLGQALPRLNHAVPVVVVEGASPALLVACFRAGAADVLDLELEGTTQLRATVVRALQRATAARAQAERAQALRGMIEEFLRELVQTERRSLDLEERLAHRARRSTSDWVAQTDDDPARRPTALVIEDDEEVARYLRAGLERAGLEVHAYLSGEVALQEVEVLYAAGTWFDVAMIDHRLPGMSGLDTIRRLRQRFPGLAVFLMTGFDAPSVGADAAALGVTGFVRKPFDDAARVIADVRAVATAALQRKREALYVRRIKERHEHVLRQYAALQQASDDRHPGPALPPRPI